MSGDFTQRSVSFWEATSWYATYDLLIVGGGLVGIQTALYSLKANPAWRIAVVERSDPPAGASTRNAGFACIGSLGELVADVEQLGFEDTVKLVAQRFTGLELLRRAVPDHHMDFQPIPNLEIFRSGEEEVLAKATALLPKINAALPTLINTVNFDQGPYRMEVDFLQTHNLSGIAAISNALEGQLHPGKMMHYLYKKAVRSGITLLNQAVKGVDSQHKTITLANGQTLKAKAMVLASNGFTAKLLGSDVVPYLNQVIVTKPVTGVSWANPIHLEQGYGYARRIGQRMLIGGFRNHFPAESQGASFRLSPKLRSHLLKGLNALLPAGRLASGGILTEEDIEYEWSGVLGIGPQRKVEVKTTAEGLILAVGMGGMGVALGSFVAKQAATIVSEQLA